MDVIAFLKKEHREIDTLFKKFDGTSERAKGQRKKLARKIVDELALHADIEEQLVYPVIEEHSRDKKPVLKAMEEHDVTKNLMQDLVKMDPEQDRFGPKVAVLMQTVRAHVKEEEKILFAALRKALKPIQLRELGKRVEEGKKAMRSPRDYLKL
jgi:hemerythrin superfamily protein